MGRARNAEYKDDHIIIKLHKTKIIYCQTHQQKQLKKSPLHDFFLHDLSYKGQVSIQTKCKRIRRKQCML